MRELPPPDIDCVLPSQAGFDLACRSCLDSRRCTAWARSYIRGLLVEYGALPRRDELAVRYDQWAAHALERVNSIATSYFATPAGICSGA